MALSHYMGQWILNWNRGIPAPNAPTSVLLSLHTGDPLEDDNGNNEVSGGNYSRQALTFTSPTLYPNITSFSGSIVNNIESGDSYSLSAGKILINSNKSISSYLAEKILNWFRGVNMPTPPVSTDLALHTSDPLPDDSAASEIIVNIEPKNNKFGTTPFGLDLEGNNSLPIGLIVAKSSSQANANIKASIDFDAFY